MLIGIPKEIMPGERRVSATPETVRKMIADGARVLLEAHAGEGSLFSDAEYVQAGAELTTDVAELYKQADVILKVKEPQFNTLHNCSEVSLMHAGQYLITFIHPAAPCNHAMVQALAACGVISMTLDAVPRISRAQSMDALTSMSTCAGYKGILMAASNLTRFMPQIFCAVGAIKPCNTLVLGTGVGGLQALATAKRLGSVIYAADIRPDAAQQAQSLGAKLVDIGIPAEISVGTGGYARRLPEQYLASERRVLASVLPEMDIVFCSALVPNEQAPILITDEMVSSMRPGSVIVDISIDQGGNCASTVAGKQSIAHGVIIEGIKNIPGMLPTSSTWMFANNIYNLLHYLIADGAIQLNREDEIVAGILTTIDGQIVHAGARAAMGL